MDVSKFFVAHVPSDRPSKKDAEREIALGQMLLAGAKEFADAAEARKDWAEKAGGAGQPPEPPPLPTPPAPPGPGPAPTPIFFTPQSLATFAGASLLINISVAIWKNAADLPPASRLPTYVCSLGVGVLVFLISLLSPTARPEGRLAWAVALGIGLANTAYLLAIALGLSVMRA